MLGPVKMIEQYLDHVRNAVVEKIPNAVIATLCVAIVVGVVFDVVVVFTCGSRHGRFFPSCFVVGR